MRILILAQRVPYPPNKGEKLRTFHQLEFLHNQGHQLSVVAPHESEQELKHFTTLHNDYCEHVCTRKLQPKALSLPLGLLKNQSLSVANFYSASLQQAFDELITSVEFDAIMCSASSMAEYVFKSSSLATLTKRPQLVMDFMDVDSDKWGQYASTSRFPISYIYQREQRLLSRYEGEIAAFFDASFFITQSEVELFKTSHPSFDTVYAIENGIDSQMFFPPSTAREPEQPAFLFAGVMDYPPNIDAVSWFVDEVWDDIIQRWPAATFVIAGMNPTDKIRQYGNKPGIEVTGFVENIKPYFDQANIFVAPFRIARGVQNKVLQAMACELPVVATPMGAEGVRCQEYHDILLAESGKDFVDCTERLMTDNKFYRQISSHALQTIQGYYSWDSILAPLHNLIKGKAPYEKLS